MKKIFCKIKIAGIIANLKGFQKSIKSKFNITYKGSKNFLKTLTPVFRWFSCFEI